MNHRDRNDDEESEDSEDDATVLPQLSTQGSRPSTMKVKDSAVKQCDAFIASSEGCVKRLNHLVRDPSAPLNTTSSGLHSRKYKGTFANLGEAILCDKTFYLELMHYLVHTAKKKNGKPLKAGTTSEYMRKLLNLSCEKFGPLPFFDVFKKPATAATGGKEGCASWSRRSLVRPRGAAKRGRTRRPRSTTVI